jgi:ferredoxin/transposase-like protein
VQSQATNPSTVRQIVTAESTIQRVAREAGLRPDQLRGRVSTQAVSGNISRLGQNPLVAITVTGHARRPVQRAANDLARTVVFSDALAGYARTKIQNLQLLVDQEKAALAALSRNLKAQQAALGNASGLSTAEQLIALGQLNGLLQQQLTLQRVGVPAVQPDVDTRAAEPGPRLLAQVSGAAGNPLFVTELLGALAQEGAITTAGGQAEVAETVLPPTLRLTILRRLSFLPEPALQALQSASILGDAAMLIDAGLDAPFSCRQGICGACACQLTSGEVEMAHNEVLEEGDLAEGYILACQALALTSGVSITY